MKIVFTGGGSGGHFYPIIAIVESIKKIQKDKKLIEPDLYFLAPDPYSKKILFDYKINYRKVPAGKKRIYSSVKNFFDKFKTGFGILKAVWVVFWIYPDVIFSKGGYGSVPVVYAGKLLGIPIIIHESDSAPGRSNLWASKYADKIAVSYPEAMAYFSKEKTAWTGNPIRDSLKISMNDGAKEFLDLEPNIPVILVLGGSQGSKIINELILRSLDELVPEYQVIHQTGINNYDEIKKTSEAILQDYTQYAHRYKPYPYLDDLAIKMSAGAADLIISRAGSTIFEISNWRKPSILIPITDSNNDHQRKNAYIYAKTGAATVIEEDNLVDDILINEIKRILENKDVYDYMVEGAKTFAKPESADIIARQIINIALNH